MVRPSFIRELLGDPASRSASSWNRRGGGPPARKDEEYRRVRRTGNDEEAVRGTGARLARVNPGCGAGVAGWGF